MRLETIGTSCFRNLGGQIDIGAGLNIFFGENGQGKTNLLEAINILATTRSFRTAKLGETIRFGESRAIINGRVRQSTEVSRDLQINIEQGSKSFSINGKRETLQRYLGQLSTVVFNAEELDVVRGQPESRRRFIDAGIVSLHPPFLQVFTDFSKVLKQKNALLQKLRETDEAPEKAKEMLAPWNEQLIALAERIHKGRIRFVERLNEVLEKRLFGGEEVSIRYVSSLEGKGDLENYAESIKDRLELRMMAEIYAGYSLIGPHRDDMEILFDRHDIRKFGSAGQQRSAFLVILLANIEVFKATRGEYPLFLIDDIDAELDYRRIGRLLEFLEGKTQTIATTSKESFINKYGNRGTVFDVDKGMAAIRANEAVSRPAALP